MFSTHIEKLEMKKKINDLMKKHIDHNIKKHNGLIELESQNSKPLLKDHIDGLEKKKGKGRVGGKKCDGMSPYTGSGLFGDGKIESSIDGLNDGMHTAETSDKGNTAGPQMSHINKSPRLSKRTKNIIKSLSEDIPEKKGKGRVGGAKTSSWIEHVKAYAKEHGVKYNQAMKDSKMSYKK